MRKPYVAICLGSVILLAFFSNAMAQSPGSIVTYAGNGYGSPNSGGYSGDRGPAISAELFDPFAVAVDKSGNVYIADKFNYCVRKVTAANGIITTVAGTCTVSGFSGDGGPATSAQMSFPAGVAVDGFGNLYIADATNYRIRKVTASTGIIATVAGNGTEGYSGDGGPATNAEMGIPYSLAVDSAGNIFIADTFNNAIRKVTASTGVITTAAGMLTSGYTGDGGPAINAELDSPQAVSVDMSGNFYILDQNNAVVRKVNGATGIISTVAGNNTWGYSGDGGPATSAQIYDATGVGVDGSGNFYIADTWNQRIRKVTVATGIITTIAGDGIQGFSGDGSPATEAEFDVPTGVAIDQSGNVFIADAENNRVRKVFPGGLAASATSLTLPVWPPLVGTAADLTAKVSAPLNEPAPSGAVKFYDGTIALGSAALDSTSRATFSIDTLSAGIHSIVAAYSGDAYLNPSTSTSSQLYVASTAAGPPTFSLAAGTYKSILQVALNDSAPFASIFYTTDGSTPTTATGTPYAGAITVNATETIRAVAVGPESAVSQVASAKYVIQLPLELPLPRGEWAWEGGSSEVGNANGPCGNGPAALGVPGVYGSLGVAAANNVPGSRSGAVQWTDKNGNFWLFGGVGLDSLAHCAELNDLWRFNPSSREWTWMGGSDAPLYFEAGVYGTLGTFAAGNAPGSREQGVTWTDKHGDLWLFGGAGYDSAGNFGYLGDIWEFNPTTSEWAWIGGSNTANQQSVYGQLHEAAAANTPGGRWNSGGWTDGNGDFWLFGGITTNAAGLYGLNNDLWKFCLATRNWAWMGGSNTVDQNGVYGTLGKPSTHNIPGARYGQVVWADVGGHVWVFGGQGEIGSSVAFMNDLWEFNPDTYEWTWISGINTLGTYVSQFVSGDAGVYGTLGTPDPGNTPGSREQAAVWTDHEGHLWLFGGAGFDATGTFRLLGDLWEFVPSTGLWAWMGGDATAPELGNGVSQPGTYGQFRVPAAANLPGARQLANSWTDNAGHLWLFGGDGDDSTGYEGQLNDLWEYLLPKVPSSE